MRWRPFFSYVFLLLIFGVVPLAFAATLKNIRILDGADTRGSYMLSDHHLAYVADAEADKLRIFRISDLGADMVETGSVDIDGTPQDIVLYWNTGTNTAFVLTSSDGIYAVDVSDPASPVVGNQLPLSGYCSHMASCFPQQRVCVACGDMGVRVVDLSDPNNMQVVGEYWNGYYFTDVDVLDQYAFAAAGPNGFLVLDINDPSNIYVRASRGASDFIHSISVNHFLHWQKGPYITLADRDAGARIYTMDPDDPMYLGRYLPGIPVREVHLQGKVLMVADDEALRMVSLSNPILPRLLTSMTTQVKRISMAGRLICGTGTNINFTRMSTTPWDYEGDGCANIAVCDPSRTMAYIRNADDTLFNNAPYELPSSNGWPQSVDNVGIGLLDPQGQYTSTGGWWWPTYGAATYTLWGWEGALPVAGDYDYDRFRDVAVYSPATSDWYIHLSSSNTIAGGGAIQWGTYPDIPVLGDYNGDGIDDLTMYDRYTGNWNIWFFDPHFQESFIINRMQINWGWHDAVPVAADYDGDGQTDIAVYHSAVGNWYLRYSSGGSEVVNWGWAEALPVPADYDGDGRDDVAVYHPGPGNWYVRCSNGGSITAQWGWSEARPPYAQYVINKAYGLLP